MAEESERDGFTETAFRELVRFAASRYAFLRFRDAAAAAAGLLWRHDIDVSPHRALALAEIERSVGVCATYFVWLHSRFYNALEAEITAKLRQIAVLGHDVGVHFDPSFYGLDRKSTRLNSS